MPDITAGFDIGGTKVSLVVADQAGTCIRRYVEPTDTSSECIEYSDAQTIYHGVSLQLERMLRSALVENELTDVRAIGVVSAGPIRDGCLWCSTNIVPSEVAVELRKLSTVIPLVEPLQKAFSCPVELLNDCNGGVLGEVFFGLGKEIQDKTSLHLAYATISTGFGVGAWDGGSLVRGREGNAGEIGHIPVYPEGLICGCGNHGCIEAYCSGLGIIRNAGSRLAKLDACGLRTSPLAQLFESNLGRSDESPRLKSLANGLTPSRVFEAAADDDPIAVAVIDDLIYAGGVAFSAIANAYDPHCISVGGGIALAHPELLESIKNEMLRHLRVTPPRVHLTTLGTTVTERGAIAIAERLLSSAR